MPLPKFNARVRLGKRPGAAGGAMFRIMNVTPLLVEHQADIIADLRRLQREGGVTDVAFLVPLRPEESRPSMGKPVRLRALFVEMRAPLRGSGLRVGIFLQSLLGHGTATAAGFRRIMTPDGTAKSSFCPLDPDFKDYVRQAVATVAAARPDTALRPDPPLLIPGE